ncbi:MAG: methyltransferase domain-containing protein, partial [Desulfobaccales bacterium]
TDINYQYLQYSKSNHRTLWHVLCDATLLPFLPSTFDRIFSLFLFHHLSDLQTLDTLKEMQICLKPDGKIVIVDLFQTEKRWDLVSRAVSRLDRGQYVRPRQSMLGLINQAGKFQVEERRGAPGEWPYSLSTYILTPWPAALHKSISQFTDNI